jgi:hypothetical protein
MNVHIYTAALQPATKFTDNNFEEPMEFTKPGGSLLWCECCGKRHPARDVVVQCFYDGWRFWCAPERGCKNPKLTEAKRRREFRNRSLGQKRRWARLRHNA